jgi:hypothetical protein
MEFVPITCKERVVSYFNYTVAVAGWPTISARFTFTGETDLYIIINSGWNGNLAFNGYFSLSLTTTVATLVTDYTSCATAGGACCLKPEDSRTLKNLTLATAIITCLWGSSSFRTVAATGCAFLMSAKVDRLAFTA